MLRMGLAPCAPFNVTNNLMVEAARLARKYAILSILRPCNLPPLSASHSSGHDTSRYVWAAICATHQKHASTATSIC